MPRRYSTMVLLVGAGLLCAAAAFAAKPAPVSESIEGQPIHGSQFTVNSTCTIGVTQAPAFIINYLLPPDDGYYTLIRSADCAACTGPGGVEAQIAHVFLNYRVACSQPVTVSIVGAVAGACPTPDLTNVIMPPIATNLTAAAAGNYNFSVPLPPGICLNGDAFLVVNFVAGGTGCSTSTTRPRLITGASCDPCTSYNIYPGGADELCDVGFNGNPIMNLEVICCSVVPTQHRSWGSLKVRYGN